MIRPFSLSELAQRSEGSLFGDDLRYADISTDSRHCQDALFVALRGARFDGHRFLADAVRNGCLALVTEEPLEAANSDQQGCEQVSGVLVNDTRKALGAAAGLNRDAFKGKVIGLTGSSGKTTTKNMLNAILSGTGPVVATEGNFNNEIGVPLTLLRLAQDTRYAVVEMGARKRGDIRYLGDFVKPDIALVLNAGLAHVGEFGSYEAIVETKGEIYECISAAGVAVLNMDDKASASWSQRIADDSRKLRYSIEDASADVFARQIHCHDAGSDFELVYGDTRQPVQLKVPGRHNVSNAVAAAALALACGCSLAEIAAGLGVLESGAGRMQRTALPGAGVLLDDSYNANPLSVKAALDVLKLQDGTRIAVLGEMGELGERAAHYHVDVARYAREAGIEQLCCCGPYAHQMVEEFGQGGYAFESKEALAHYVLKQAPQPAAILVKGSRMAGMETVVAHLRGGLH